MYAYEEAKKKLIKEVIKLELMFRMPSLTDHPVKGLRLEYLWVDKKAEETCKRYKELLVEMNRKELENKDQSQMIQPPFLAKFKK